MADSNCEIKNSIGKIVLDLLETSEEDSQSELDVNSNTDEDDSSCNSEQLETLGNKQTHHTHGRRKFETREAKKERKDAVKTQKREQRMAKIPKHIKKRKEKAGRKSIQKK